MKKSIMYVGLDVHKNSIEIAFADSGRDSEVRSDGTIDGNLDALDKVIRKLVSKNCNLSFVYEAGPCGYEIYRHLTAKGFDCIVAAPSKIPRQAGNRIKNDRRDAQMLARLHRAGELTAVSVPLAEDEASGIWPVHVKMRKPWSCGPSNDFWPSCFAMATVSQDDQVGAMHTFAGCRSLPCRIQPSRLSSRNSLIH